MIPLGRDTKTEPLPTTGAAGWSPLQKYGDQKERRHQKRAVAPMDNMFFEKGASEGDGGFVGINIVYACADRQEKTLAS